MDVPEPLRAEERAALLDGLGQAVIATDLGGRVTYWNAAAETLYGWTAEEALGVGIQHLTVPTYSAGMGEEIMEHVRAGAVWSGSFTVRRKDRSTFTAIVTDAGIRDERGELVGIVGVSINVGQVLRPLLRQSQEAVVVTTEEGVVLLASPVVEGVLRIADSELVGRSLYELAHAEDQPLLERCAAECVEARASTPRAEFRIRTREGDPAWVEAVVASLLDDPNIGGLVWTMRDVTERVETLERMTDIALHDPLTGLPNRVLLADRIALATARREPHGALLFIDLDDFKQTNDELGHAAGDELLKTIGDRLAHLVRPEDSCGRWSGDEFVILSESLDDPLQVRALTDRVRRHIAEPVEIEGRQVAPQASIGVAMLDGVHDPDALLRLADEQMYLDKRAHRRARGRPA